MIYDNLKDVLKHTQDLGFIEKVKLIGTDNEDGLGITKVETLNENKSVVIYGELVNEISELHDEVIGLSRLPVLKGYLNYEPFMENKSGVSITMQKRGEGVAPTEISFTSSVGHAAQYRVIHQHTIEKALVIPEFTGIKPDITYKPTKQNVSDLQYFSGLLSKYSPTFNVVLEDGDLSLSIGSGPTDRSIIPFASDITGTFSPSWNWPLNEVLRILKLGVSEECVMRFSDDGLLILELNSGLGIYEYVMVAKV